MGLAVGAGAEVDEDWGVGSVVGAGVEVGIGVATGEAVGDDSIVGAAVGLGDAEGPGEDVGAGVSEGIGLGIATRSSVDTGTIGTALTCPTDEGKETKLPEIDIIKYQIIFNLS